MANLIDDYRPARNAVPLGKYDRWLRECITGLLQRHDARVAREKHRAASRRKSAAMLARQAAGRRISSNPPYGWAVDPAKPWRLDFVETPWGPRRLRILPSPPGTRGTPYGIYPPLTDITKSANAELNEGNASRLSWVPASTLWSDRFASYKRLTKFRTKHPEMFRNPSRFRLEIHAGMWATYWAKHNKASFDSLDTDSTEVQEAFTAGAENRKKALRAKKQQKDRKR